MKSTWGCRPRHTRRERESATEARALAGRRRAAARKAVAPSSGIGLFILLLSSSAFAAFEDLGAGARAPGMANAFTAVSDDAYAVHYNPAGLALLDRPQAALSHSRLHLGLTDGSSLSVSDAVYAQPVRSLAGVLAASWQRFALAGAYDESTYRISFARQALESSLGTLYAGLNLKLIGISFMRNDDAVNAQDANLNVVGADPVLSGPTRRHSQDLDLGLLWRTPGRLSYGLNVQHLPEPNVGFASSDRLPRAYRLGLGYKSLWLNLAANIRLDRAPDGKAYREIALGGERYFPSLNVGQVGVRGGLAVGTHESRHVTAGVSYRINKLQFDYALLIPLGAVPNSAGTHRMGLTLHFGAPTVEDAYRERLAKMIAEGPRVEGYAYEFEEVKPEEPIPLVTLSTAATLIQAGRYQEAYTEVVHILETRATKVEVLALARRLEALTTHYQSLEPSADSLTRELARAMEDYLTGKDYAAVLRTSYVLSIASTPQLSAWLTQLSQITQIKPHVVPAGAGLSLLELKLRDSETVFLLKRPKEAEVLLRDVVTLQPGHRTALARLGSALYAQGRYPEAIEHWTRAIAADPKSPENQTIRYMIGQANLRMPKPKPKPVRKPEPGEFKVDARLIENLYQRGVELYLAGHKGEALDIYHRILELDPKNRQTRKAIERLDRELLLKPEAAP